jgi:hypothetical protein
LNLTLNFCVNTRLGSLPLFVMSYLGALKAWIYAPIFHLFGTSPLRIRRTRGDAIILFCMIRELYTAYMIARHREWFEQHMPNRLRNPGAQIWIERTASL